MRPHRCIPWLLLAGSVLAAEVTEQPPIPHPESAELKSESLRDIITDARDLFRQQMDFATEDTARTNAFGRLGMVYQSLSFEEAARAAYDNALRLNPDDPRWHHFLAFLYQEQGNRERALKQYRRVLELEPNYLPARVRLALLLYDAGQKAEAEAEFAAVLAAQPNNAPAIAGMGRIAMDAGRTRDAIERFEQALQLDAQANQLHYLLGLAYRQVGDMERARRHLDQAGDRIPRIDDPWLVTMQVHSQTADYYLAQGLQAVQTGQLRDAYNVFQLAALVDPDDPSVYVSLARASQALGNLEATEGFINQALALAPENANILFNVGLLNDQLGNTQQAMDYYRRALEKDPDSAEALVYLGHALMREGKPAEAAEYYARASVIHESTEVVLHLQALAYLGMGECKQAIDLLQQSLAIDPSQGDVLQTQARTFATCPAATEAQKRTAWTDARALYDLRPNLEHAETLAMTEAAMGNYQDAVDFQTQAVFEAIKAGGPEKSPGLIENLERYRNEQPAVRAWPPDHPVFAPQPPSLPTPGDAAGEDE